MLVLVFIDDRQRTSQSRSTRISNARLDEVK